MNDDTATSKRSGSITTIILEEIKRPGGVILALVVGTTLTFSKRFESIAIVLPFVVPFLVGLFTRVIGRVAARRRELLLNLPALRRDPAFIVDRDGMITASTGNTEALFRRHEITRIDQFLQEPVDGTITANGGANGGSTVRVTGIVENPVKYSPVTEKWYRVETGRTITGGETLVWLDDVTPRIRLEERKDALRDFTSKLRDQLNTTESSGDDDRRLADLLLSEGYRVIMLARIDGGPGSASKGEGILYSNDGRRSDPIRFSTDSDAPIIRSRREGRAIWARREDFASERAFQDAYPVLPEVREFLGEPLENLANYHAGEVSIIAFNKNGDLSSIDIDILESVADTAVTAFSLLDLSRRAERRFIQAIHGVCAAAEYSDELTGHHIWRVNDYSRHMAYTLGLDPAIAEQIGIVAAMHDIGKVAIPEIIKLERPLTPTEREAMQMHTIYGAQIIERMLPTNGEEDPRLERAYRIALHHHQEWDGNGYPRIVDAEGSVVRPTARHFAGYSSLRPARGEEIPLEARIVSVADKYDALRSCRQYKPAFTHEEACGILQRDDRTGRTGSETFGGEVYQAFMDTRGEFSAIYEAVRTTEDCTYTGIQTAEGVTP